MAGQPALDLDKVCYWRDKEFAGAHDPNPYVFGWPDDDEDVVKLPGGELQKASKALPARSAQRRRKKRVGESVEAG